MCKLRGKSRNVWRKAASKVEQGEPDQSQPAGRADRTAYHSSNCQETPLPFPYYSSNMSTDDLAFLNDVLGSQAAPPNSSGDDGADGGADGRQVNGGTITSNDSSAAPGHQQTPNLASLQPILQALKISAISEEDLANMSDDSISAMLAKLDEANLVTDGLESRLDQLLGQLDGMLENLETSSADEVEQEIEASVTEVQSGRIDEQDNVVNGQIVNHKEES